MLRSHAEIESFYREQFIEHGAVPRGVAWADAGEHYIRTARAMQLAETFSKIRGRILEIGCGYGYLPYIWETLGLKLNEYTGVDLVEETIEHARQLVHSTNAVFVAEPFEDFQWLDPYDLTIAIGVIAWQPELIARNILMRLWDATKPGGWMLFTYLPNHPFAPQVIHMLRTHLSAIQWVEYSGYAKSRERMIMFRKGDEVKDNGEESSDNGEGVALV